MLLLYCSLKVHMDRQNEQTENGQTEIVQFGLPHGVLDLGLKVNLFQNQLPQELVSGRHARNIVLFEEAGLFTRDEALQFSQELQQGTSFTDAFLGFRRSDQREIDHLVFSILTTPPRTEHEHASVSQSVFLDWFINKYGRHSNLVVIPESFETAEMRDDIRGLAYAAITSPALSGKTLNDILVEFAALPQNSSPFVLARDKAIARFLESQLTPNFVQQGTRTKIIISIGSAHKHIQSSMSKDSLARVDYREIIHDSGVEGKEIESRFADPLLPREKAARIICYRIISAQLKRSFLKSYSGIMLKEPGKDEAGRTAFDYAYEVCEALPIEAVYMFLQELVHVDCGLEPTRYPQIDLPDPLSLDADVFLSKIESFTHMWGVNDLSNSEIGIFLDKKVVERGLFIIYAIFDLPVRRILSLFIQSLSASHIRNLKEEFILYFRSGGLTSTPFLRITLTDLLSDKTHIHGESLALLRNFFSRFRG